MALTLNGKKSRLKSKDFLDFAKTIGLNDTSIINSNEKIFRSQGAMKELIKNSFLSETKKTEYIALLQERNEQIQ